jgi:Mlc titration factor MtfA (ptsG expression regulator)
MSLLRQHHRRKLKETPFPESWQDILDADVPYTQLLDEDELTRLREIIAILVDEKYWEGCGELEVNERMLVVIAAQAAIMLLHCDSTDYFHNVRTFLLYPAAYVQTQERIGSDGLVHSGSANLGEAWYNGPIVLSWKDSLQSSHSPGRGLNVVFHELAHAADMMTGSTNGTPLLKGRDDYASWNDTMSRTFAALRQRYASGGRDVIRPYGLTNVAEFFAVTTECFFDAPIPFRKAHPKVYGHYTRFWGQDPASRPWPHTLR